MFWSHTLPHTPSAIVLTLLLVSGLLAGCTLNAPPDDPLKEYGEQPSLAAPKQALLPTINPAKAVGWPEGQMPTTMPGLMVTAFAQGLQHPRWLLPLPNGDILVAESNRPATEGGYSGIKGWIANRLMDYAGAGTPSADRITLLRDTNGDGSADVREMFLSGLHSPFGMALVDGRLYIANANAVVAVEYTEGDLRAPATPEAIADLPGGPLNHHWTKNLLEGMRSGELLVAVGSNSNIGENGLAAETNRAAILVVDVDTGRIRTMAAGLRNPVGMARHPTTGTVWTVVNERDELGDQLVPDYLTSVRDGDDFGWPSHYWGDIADPRVTPSPHRQPPFRTPDYALGAHTASLGLAFYHHDAIEVLHGKALIGQHGSWNRRNPSGYKVIAVPFEGGAPSGSPIDVLTGFLSTSGEAFGRPAGVTVDRNGHIYVADDVGNTVWRVSPEQ